MSKVDIIIPTYKPDQTFVHLIDLLQKQTVKINQIIVINTEQKFFDRLIYGTAFEKNNRNLLIKHISKHEFDHGRTRNMGVKYSDADYFIMMTQDAVPADNELVEKLLQGLKAEGVAVAYARQLPAKNCGVVENYTRSFNYPDTSMEKSREDLATLGIKTYFCSNVCAAYKRSVFDKLGGFIKHTIFNEDMIFAAKAIENNYKIRYVAEAKVYHSHNYSNREQFHRNFDLGVSQADHPEIFAGVPSEGEGKKLVMDTLRYLYSTKKKRYIPHLIMQSGCKYLGYLLGKHYRKIPYGLVVRLSDNKEYWNQDNRIKASSHIDPTKGYGRSEQEMMKK